MTQDTPSNMFSLAQMINYLHNQRVSYLEAALHLLNPIRPMAPDSCTAEVAQMSTEISLAQTFLLFIYRNTADEATNRIGSATLAKVRLSHGAV